jgi:hypothetical protein
METKQRLNAILAKHTGQTVERIKQDSDRDNFMTAETAKELRNGRPCSKSVANSPSRSLVNPLVGTKTFNRPPAGVLFDAGGTLVTAWRPYLCGRSAGCYIVSTRSRFPA